MKNYLIKLISLFQILTLSAHSWALEMDLNRFLDDSYDHSMDIAHVYMVPEFEDSQDPDQNPVTLEIFQFEVSDDEESERKLQWLAEKMQEEKRINPELKSEVVALGPSRSNIRHNRDAQNFVNKFKFDNSEVRYEELPRSLSPESYTSVYDKNGDRKPARVNHRTMITLVKIGVLTGGGFYSLYYTEDVNPYVLLSVAMVPALASGAITYFSAHYGKFLGTPTWSTWLLESKNPFSRKLRKRLGINPESLEDMLKKKRREMARSFPGLTNELDQIDNIVRDMTDENLKKMAKELTGETARTAEEAAGLVRMAKKTKILSQLAKGEEYLKFFVTEVAFTGLTIKAPQALAGIGTTTSLGAAITDVLQSSAIGMLAQAPGDIAIQRRKYQKVAELKEAILSGARQVDDKAALLAEIEKVLDNSGQYKNYVIHDGSHKALVAIEKWARNRGAALSILQVIGVGMDVAGVPIAKPWLISIGVGGGLYWGKVYGYIPIPEPVSRFSRQVENLWANSRYKLMGYIKNFCRNKFIPRK